MIINIRTQNLRLLTNQMCDNKSKLICKLNCDNRLTLLVQNLVRDGIDPLLIVLLIPLLPKSVPRYGK